MKLRFKKLDEKAVVPSKRKEDMGYDIYGVFDDNIVVLKPGEIIKVGCKISSIIPEGYGVILKERSSLGSKGIAVRAGVIDSGYRGEWIVCLNNTSNNTFVFTDSDKVDIRDINVDTNNNIVKLPMSKAICQAVLIKMPEEEIEVEEVSSEEFNTYKSERGIGGFGSTCK